MSRKRLSEAEIATRLAEVPGWERAGETITRSLRFPGFREAVAFVNRVAELAESADHHPDITIRYVQVSLSLATHDAGGLTALDFDLARRIDAVA